MTITKSKKGFVVSYSNIVNGMLEQGGRTGVKVLVPYQPALDKQTDLDAPWNDIYSVQDILLLIAKGKMGDYGQRTLRKGALIR